MVERSSVDGGHEASQRRWWMVKEKEGGGWEGGRVQAVIEQ